uniref:Uncharacterized protein n=1 Tax=Eubacterium cellulosolvens (strain ATCC 43171 / JCM 9499 / 6) TaxID=633697 RepID=I5ASH8_EUBC6
MLCNHGKQLSIPRRFPICLLRLSIFENHVLRCLNPLIYRSTGVSGSPRRTSLALAGYENRVYLNKKKSYFYSGLCICVQSAVFLSHRKFLRISHETKRSAGCAARRWEDRFAILLARQSPAALPSGLRGWGSRSPLADFVLEKLLLDNCFRWAYVYGKNGRNIQYSTGIV